MSCAISVLTCVSLASMYVGSLYIWRSTHGRDHPSTVKKRFISVLFMTLVSASSMYLFVDVTYFPSGYSYWSLLGLQTAGLLQAVIVPLVLTIILFLGPLALHYVDGIPLQAFDVKLWKSYVTDIFWLRNHVVAPFSEEFTFRACMLPLLVPCFGIKNSVILCPFFFGIAHLHHMREKLACGMKVKTAILQSLFQFAYTTVFGAYSTYLFLRTGHFSAPFIAHAFCNCIGFPDFGQLLQHKQPKKSFLMICFVTGLVLWMLLLKPLTEPNIYSNAVYWHTTAR